MSASNQGLGLGLQRLTSDNLLTIPRRNSVLFLSDYLQEQLSYARDYASEGLTTMFSWNHSEPPGKKNTPAKKSLDEFLLGTPVLKPRASAAAVIDRSVSKALEFSDESSKKTEDHASRKAATGHPTRTKFPGPADRDSSTADNNNRRGIDREESPSKNKKRTENERGGSDEEIFKRLQERRERKRLKKSVMTWPANGSDSEKENIPRRTKKKGGRKNKTKLQDSFALMHGFTATNVGKGRITPLLRNVGVFKKGKASRSLKTGKLTTKNQSDHDVYFSEARFLKNTQAKPNKTISFESSSASSSSSGIFHKKKITVKHIEAVTGFKKSKDVDNGVGESPRGPMCGDIDIDRRKDVPAQESRRSYDPADSIMWDIERESYVEESEASRRQGTLVMNVPGDLLARGRDEERRPNALTEMPVVGSDVLLRNGVDTDANLTKTSEDSLHPSHSASRVVQGQPKSQETGNQGDLTFSKYFFPGNIITTELNIHNRPELCRLPTPHMLQPRLERNASKSIVHHSPPRNGASATSTSLQMLGDKHPLATVRSPEHNAMELVRYDVFHDRDASLGPELWSRSDGELFEVENITSGKFMQHDPVIKLNDDPLFQEEELYCFSDEWCRQSVDSIEGEGDGVAVFKGQDRSVNGYEPGTDAFSRIAPSDFGSADDASENNVCIDFSPIRADFSQGRSLLYGWDHGNARVSDAEAEVAKLLKQKHWLPHRH